MRAKFIAETMLDDPVCFNRVRGMLGFTGTYQGKPVSVMGTGMGIPSHTIYVHELLADYGVQTLVRVGSCGSLQSHVHMGDIVLAMAASTDSHVNRLRFGGRDYAPTADFDLLVRAREAARAHDVHAHVGSIFSGDTFYDEPDWWHVWAEYGVLAVEMETAGLYTLAARFQARALAILTVTDNLVTEEAATSELRETGIPLMARIALEIVP
jgi:purine-nucleoside phosphorylase